MARVFISYKRNADPDERLADYFVQHLIQQGHDVFIDKSIQIGDNWSAIIEQKIDVSNFFIVLLSEASVGSEMVMEEISRAHSLKKERGFPIIISIRVAYTLPYTKMPYKLGAMLNLLQDVTWKKDGDETEIAQKLDLTIAQNHPLVQDLSIKNKLEMISALACDGNVVLQSDLKLALPLPAFDPQWLKELDVPGGAVRLESPFYMERQEDIEAKEQILRKGTTIRIKGSRQIGKTSLLARLYQHAHDNERPVVYIDFQEMDDPQFKNLDTLLWYLAYRIADDQQKQRLNDYWKEPLGSKDKITRFIGKEVLGSIKQPLVLIMDEVDRLFNYVSYRDDFFSLIRSWHNKRAMPTFEVWKKLNIVLTYSTEAFAFIANLNQSPFNVGVDLSLVDFDRTHVETLNWQHNTPIKTPQEMDDFMELLRGHPFLVRKAFYMLTVKKLTVDRLIQCACDDDGPFSDHLHSYLWRFNENQELCQGMRSVLKDHTCSTDLLFYQLRSSGLVYGNGRTNVLPRCGLYTRYFGKHL